VSIFYVECPHPLPLGHGCFHPIPTDTGVQPASQPASQPVGFRHTKLFRPSLGAHDSVASTKLQMREERDCRSRHLDSTFDRSISNVVVTVVQVPDTARGNSAADGRGGTRSGETAIHCSRHPGSNGSSTHASAAAILQLPSHRMGLNVSVMMCQA
jgi:hypothetical protein